MDSKIINGIRSLALDMINEASSGHPGICLDAAPAIYTLFANHLNFNKEDGTGLWGRGTISILIFLDSSFLLLG